jgi:hypothetical protein
MLKFCTSKNIIKTMGCTETNAFPGGLWDKELHRRHAARLWNTAPQQRLKAA